jgi:hypothetical protein
MGLFDGKAKREEKLKREARAFKRGKMTSAKAAERAAQDARDKAATRREVAARKRAQEKANKK